MSNPALMSSSDCLFLNACPVSILLKKKISENVEITSFLGAQHALTVPYWFVLNLIGARLHLDSFSG